MNVVVAETSYQMLEVLAFCDPKRAEPPAIKIKVLIFLVKKSAVKLSGVSSVYSLRIREKKYSL